MSKRALSSHVLYCINQQDVERLQFNSREGLQKWIEDMQLRTNTYYSARCGKILRPDKVFSYLYCQHRDQSTTVRTERKTERKRKCGLVPDYNCPSKIAIKEKNSIIQVKFYKAHTHPFSNVILKYQPYPKTFRNQIAASLELGIDSRRILDDNRSDKWDRRNRTANIEINKLDHINPR